MSGQRARSAVAVAHRSALPRLPGIPWWAAILLAATAAAVGFAYDAGSGSKELSGFFAFCYVTGCILAVLAVRQSGVFTAVIQPPLILFGVVPAAYFLFHGATIGGIKDILINCGYPLIERFPLMFFTSAAVLVIGLVRWYLGTLTRRSATDEPAETKTKTSRRAASRLATEETTTLDAVDAAPRRRKRERTAERPERTREAVPSEDAAPRRPRTASAAGASRSRHTRPPETDLAEPAARPRRRQGPPVDSPDDPPTEIRRRSRAGAPRDPRRDLPPVESRGPRERPERRERPRPSERREGFERPERSERRRRPPVREGYETRETRETREQYELREPSYESYDPFEPRSSNGNNGSHHPVSRVRYRGSDQEPDVTPRSRPRRPADSDLDSWEFDV